MTLNKTNIRCIICPRGCLGEVIHQQGSMLCIGYGCQRGEEYVHQESIEPKRKITTTIKILGGTIRWLPVVTNQPVPKQSIFECVKRIHQTVVKAPVKCGDVVLPNILGFQIDVLAARDVAQN